MHGADDDVESFQYRIREIKAAVIEDIDLDPFQDGDTRERAVDAVDFVDLLQDAARIEAARNTST